MEKINQTERWAALVLIFLLGSGVVAHQVPQLAVATAYLNDVFLLLGNGSVLYFLWQRHRQSRLWQWLVVTVVATFAIEVAGVKTGLIFGHYWYGEAFLLQALGVPLVIGLNWAILILASTQVALRFTSLRWLVALFAGIIIVVFDAVMEPIAMQLDYWQWQAGTIPSQNYLAWGVIAVGFSLWAQHLGLRLQSIILPIYFFGQLLFFLSMHLLRAV